MSDVARVVPVMQCAAKGVFSAMAGCEGAVLVRLYPGTDVAVEMRLEAAEHLLRLLERYNWALADAAYYRDRWRKFWPGITVLERAMVVMVVRTNSAGAFSRPLAIGVLPGALEDVRGNRRMEALGDVVAREFATLLHIHYRAVVTLDAVQVLWRERLRTHQAMPGAALAGALEAWLSGNGYDGQSLHELLVGAMVDAGVSGEEAKQWAFRFDEDVHDVIREHEERLYCLNGPVRTRAVNGCPSFEE